MDPPQLNAIFEAERSLWCEGVTEAKKHGSMMWFRHTDDPTQWFSVNDWGKFTEWQDITGEFDQAPHEPGSHAETERMAQLWNLKHISLHHSLLPPPSSKFWENKTTNPHPTQQDNKAPWFYEESGRKWYMWKQHISWWSYNDRTSSFFDVHHEQIEYGWPEQNNQQHLGRSSSSSSGPTSQPHKRDRDSMESDEDL